MTNPATNGQWLPDPSARHQLRWWDGAAWTDHVSDNGATSTDAADATWPAPAPGAPAGTGADANVPVHPNTTTIFVLGLVSVLCCSFMGPFAWVMGHRARKETAAQPDHYASSNGLLTAGWVLGIIGSVIFIVWILWMVLVLMGAASMDFSAGS